MYTGSVENHQTVFLAYFGGPPALFPTYFQSQYMAGTALPEPGRQRGGSHPPFPPIPLLPALPAPPRRQWGEGAGHGSAPFLLTRGWMEPGPFVPEPGDACDWGDSSLPPCPSPLPAASPFSPFPHLSPSRSHQNGGHSHFSQYNHLPTWRIFCARSLRWQALSGATQKGQQEGWVMWSPAQSRAGSVACWQLCGCVVLARDASLPGTHQ